MADEVVLPATVRTEFGKGPSRRDRVAGRIPAVIYGHGADPVHVSVPTRNATLALRVQNALITLDIEGDRRLVLVKEIQRNAVKQAIDHIDFINVRTGEKVEVDVNVHVEGEPAPGAVLNIDTPSITIEAEATNLPDALVVDVTGRGVGDHVFASDLVLPEGVALVTDPQTLVVNINAPSEQDLGESKAEASETAGDAEEPAE